MGFLGDFFSRIGNIPSSIIGALIGLCAGIIVLAFGFFPFLFLAVLTICGAIIGKMIDEDAPIIVSLKKIFSGKKSNDYDDDELNL